jgi:hypothetical protein
MRATAHEFEAIATWAASRLTESKMSKRSNGTPKTSQVPSKQPSRKPRTAGSWSASQVNINPSSKSLLAKYFVQHDFLSRPGRDAELDQRERAAHILVAPGTTPATVVRHALDWMAKHWDPDPFTVTWYPLGALIPATLFDFKQDHVECESAARLFLIPGEVDPQCECVIGNHPIRFLDKLDVQVHGAILSAYRFDLSTGKAYFYFHSELQVQRAAAMRPAAEKYVFLDVDKFSSIGGTVGYSVANLLKSSSSVTIYTNSSPADNDLIKQFKLLCKASFDACRDFKSRKEGDKRLRFCLVNNAAESEVDLQLFGTLKLHKN